MPRKQRKNTTKTKISITLDATTVNTIDVIAERIANQDDTPNRSYVIQRLLNAALNNNDIMAACGF